MGNRAHVQVQSWLVALKTPLVVVAGEFYNGRRAREELFLRHDDDDDDGDDKLTRQQACLCQHILSLTLTCVRFVHLKTLD